MNTIQFKSLTNFNLNLNSIFRMKRILLFSISLMLSVLAIAQPTVFFTNAAAGTATPLTNSRLVLTDKGSFRQAIFQVTTTTQASKTWAFSGGTAATPDYTHCWRPYASGSTALSINSIIVPSTTTPAGIGTGALYNNNGGTDGLLPSMTLSQYYIFNVEENANPTNNYMSMIATGSTVAPSNIVTTLTHTSGTSTVTLSAALASYEYLYVRSSTDGFATSQVAQVGAGAALASGAQSFVLPIAGSTSTGTVTYYFFTSNQTLTALQTSANANGGRAYDLLSINLNNNGGLN